MAAELLSSSPRTVESHKYNVMGQVGIKTTVKLVQFPIQQGLAGC